MPCPIPGCGWLFDPCPYHGPAPSQRKSPPPSPVTAESERDRALDQVEQNASEAWKAQAYAAICARAAQPGPFTSSDLWAAGLPRARESRALGPMFLKAMREGVIKPTGHFVKGQQVSRHAAPEREWIGVQW